MKLLVFFVLTLAATAPTFEARILKVPVVEPEGRIIGGQEANIRELPYMALLKIVKTNNMLEVCGGSILNINYILTAAHCVDGSISGTVTTGTTFYNGGKTACNFLPDNIIIHDDWNPETFYADIALINCPKIELSDNVKAIKLPSRSITSGTEAYVAGWGKTSDASNRPSSTLSVALVKTLSNPDCVNSQSKLPFDIPENVICISTSAGSSPCHGDSGSPLASPAGDVLYGIISYGAKKCESRLPAVCTDVHKYLQWIIKKIGSTY